MMGAQARIAQLSTHQRILNEAERLIAVKGVYGFALRDIAGPLGVRVPAIYKHFKSRDDVMVEVSRRFIALLSTQFELRPDLEPLGAMRAALDDFVEFMMNHPAYVRLALVDFATPGGGVDYVKTAAGGSFQDNFLEGPLASMHARLRKLLQAGVRGGKFRAVDPLDVYRLVKASVLIRLVFPDDSALARAPTSGEVRATQRWLWDIALGYLAPRQGSAVNQSGASRSPTPRRRPTAKKR
jgi:AcrR family transcriptional regulator